MSLTVKKDTIKSPQEALIEIYRKMRPGDPPTLETSQALFHGMFFDARKFDFSRVGRLKFNIKMGRPERERLDDPLLSPQDFFEVIDYVLKLKKLSGRGEPVVTADGRTIYYTDDDIDHLGNRRVRAVGELLENQFRLGLVRMERAIKEKMSIHQEMQTAMPRDLINAKPVTAAVREFFGSSQLSQFMDQTNPLSEITHKRRLSALGPGGLSRERAGFEVRDVHPTHYGRICPIETPEGPNIGLISSLSCFARINEFGFIESPYRKVENGRVIDYVKIIEPGRHRVQTERSRPGRGRGEGQQEDCAKARRRRATSRIRSISRPGKKTNTSSVRRTSNSTRTAIWSANASMRARPANSFWPCARKCEFMDVSPKQLVSVAACADSLPRKRRRQPRADGFEHAAPGRAAAARRSAADRNRHGDGHGAGFGRGRGRQARRRRRLVDSERIIIRVDHNVDGTLSREVTADIYPLIKFKRSNQNTCINQKPIVKKGERVKKGDVIADGPCTDGGELALGRNVLVAFMPWRGYNFEDAILVSEKMVKDDYYTSIHIEELEIEARDTKLGPEEITRDIPNVGEAALRDLDESGIIRIGA